MEQQARPYVICHMLTSIDGKVTGDFINIIGRQEAFSLYLKLHSEYNINVFALGRTTCQEGFCQGITPDLTAFSASHLEKVDYIADKTATSFVIVYDRKGKLGWKSGKIETKFFPGFDGAHVIEVLTKEGVSESYLAYLQDKGVSYIFAENICESLIKVKQLFGIEKVLLEGGSEINGAFALEGLVDEISLLQSPVLAGKDIKCVFFDSKNEAFKLKSVKQEDNYLIVKYVKDTK